MPRSVAEILPFIPPATASQDGLAPAALITGDAGVFNPVAVNLAATRAYDDYSAPGATIQLALTGGQHFPGATATVRRTGASVSVTVDGVTVFWADGDTGAKAWSDKATLSLYYHPGLGAALAIVPGDAGTSGGGAWGTIVGTLNDQIDLQAALDAKQADLAVPSQAEAEAGTATTERVWTALRVRQAAVASANAIVPNIPSFTGPLVPATHHRRTIRMTGPIQAPNTDGFECELINKSGVNHILSPIVGNGTLIHDGVPKTQLSIPTLRFVAIKGDGVDIQVAGAVG